MENKEELEKLVEKCRPVPTEVDIDNPDHRFAVVILEELWVEQEKDVREAISLADKQGYMRGVEEALRALPKIRPLTSGIRASGWNAHHSQAHDAISKLKEA